MFFFFFREIEFFETTNQTYFQYNLRDMDTNGERKHFGWNKHMLYVGEPTI